MTLCPCQSNKNYQNCCGLYLEGIETPATPEALMRSRYTAYTQANIAYIQATMKHKAAENFSYASSLAWAKQVEWLGLKIIHTEVAPDHRIGYVEFIARFRENQQEKMLHEKSKFKFESSNWYYVDGEIIPASKTGRNDPCICGSGNKFKKCCGK